MSDFINLLELIEEWDTHHKFSEDSYYTYYERARKYKELYERIKVLYEYKWCVDRSFHTGLTIAIEKWLRNFRLRREQKIAFELIPKIVFYSRKEMQTLCEMTFKYLVQSVETDLNQQIDTSFIHDHFIFVPPTDSGAQWCRQLRQDHSLSTRIVKQSINDMEVSDFVDGKYIIFVEDFVGSGSNARLLNRKLKLAEKKRKIPNIHFYYFALVATSWGMKDITVRTAFEGIAGEVLSTRYKCFSPESVMYPESTESAEAKQVFQEYGSHLCNNDPEIHNCPLGFNHDQLTVVLFDNTPDNSLPVIWYPGKKWRPLFRRSPRR